MAKALMQFLDPEAICLGVEAIDDSAVIRLLGNRLLDLGYVKESFTEAVLAREASMPTGLPLGTEHNVAVPHTDPVHVIKPGLALATLATPVSFSNMEDPDDKLQVGVVIVMALNDKDRQIDMLQEIIGAIQTPGVLAALRNARSIEDVALVLG
ncbi:PTS sugar transporter subunit IIA [Mesorhizobium sp. NBSH29]|uniref:PTS sugar transporter subunit IIA n=1 Tax=Mesorhizobium sp. NBSH29 TaxID=2654249 RepID=UPI00189668D6|nr:PTS sugar transporter subunit IIA [Mesorhizobium sp. NBSH29]QPC88212.1 PTS sugar transporter subunit IIA [Mesorhizobium sp. NBSH29]